MTAKFCPCKLLRWQLRLKNNYVTESLCGNGFPENMQVVLKFFFCGMLNNNADPYVVSGLEAKSNKQLRLSIQTFV